MRRPVFDKYLTVTMTDVSTAGSVYVPVPAAGFVVEVRSVAHGAITVADATITVSKNGTAMTGGSITIESTSAAAGDIASCTPSAGHHVDAGDYIEIETDGASTTTVAVTFTIVIRERSKP